MQSFLFLGGADKGCELSNVLINLIGSLHNVTINQIIGWNRGLQGSCDNLYHQMVCKRYVCLA
jgi:hypothetical protein